MKSVLLLLLSLNFSFSAVRNTYEGWKVYRIWLNSEQLVEDLGLLYDNTLNIDYWTTIRETGQPVDVAVAEIAHPSFENILYKINITHRVEIEQLHKTLNKERNDMRKVPPLEEGQMNFATYHRYETIMSYLNSLPRKYEDLVEVESIGTTFEGRDIKVVRISTGGDDKPAILIDAALSPREWIGSAQALYIITYLLDESNKALIEKVDWYIVPLVNPDGYEYTHTIQRLWKKNRSTHPTRNYGVYINRNFDVNWGEKLSKDDPESWNYHGSRPFSEPESLALKNLIEQNAHRIQLYLSLHSFGPTILYPYGFTADKPENIKLHKWLAEKASQAISEHTEEMIGYRARSSSGKRFFFSGSSVDWAAGVVGIPLAYTVELPSPGFVGFDFPISKIERVVREFIPGLVVFHDFIETSFYNPDEIDRDGIVSVVIEEVEGETDVADEGESCASNHCTGDLDDISEEIPAEDEEGSQTIVRPPINDEL